MTSGCSVEGHEDRAKRYKYCFDCGEQISTMLHGKRYAYPPCTRCGKPTYSGWEYCGWCGLKLK